MKKNFTAGLAILLPVVLTAMIVNFFVNFTTQPFFESTKVILLQLFHDSPFFSNGVLLTISCKILILLFLVLIIIGIGFIGKWFLIDWIFRLGDFILHRIPYVNKIYKTCHDITHSLFSSSSQSFSRVVMVPFPNVDHLTIGLVANDSLFIKNYFSESQENELVPVFVPGTPNPSVGLMILFKKEQLITSHMKVEDAIKFVMSGGLVYNMYNCKK